MLKMNSHVVMDHVFQVHGNVMYIGVIVMIVQMKLTVIQAVLQSAMIAHTILQTMVLSAVIQHGMPLVSTVPN